MDDLIEALTILRGYANPKNPTHCEHDELRVYVEPELVLPTDIVRLEKLGFFPDENCFMSYRFGSC